MNDDRLHGMLDAASRPRSPDPAFAAALLADLGDELGFAGTRRLGQATGRTWRGAGRTKPARRGPLRLLLIAVIVVGSAGGLVATAGAIRERLDAQRPPNLLAELRRIGHIRIAIRPDHPQFTLGGQTATGFDEDVAGAIARRLGVTSNIVIEDESTMIQQSHGETWDIALPSVPIWTIDSSAFLVSVPYYRWPHLLIVASTSAAVTARDIAAGPICAVAGDAGGAWLSGDYGGVSTAPIGSNVLIRPADAECLAALASGEAVAAVTAHLSAADVAVHADVRVIGGPPPEPRAVILPLHRVPDPDSDQLLRAVNDAIVGMQADGTLTRLSQKYFGGDDLTAP